MKNEYITRTKITMTKFLKNYMDYFEEKTFIRTKTKKKYIIRTKNVFKLLKKYHFT